MAKKTKTIGLALGGGGARGWFHVGVIKVLGEAGIPIDYVAGTSIGALMGGVYASGKLKELEEFGLSLSATKIISMLDLSWSSKGFLAGNKVAKLLGERFTKKDFKQTQIPFAAVATDMRSGEEVVLDRGRLPEAIRASIGIPGVFEPLVHRKRYLLDGGLTNPMPVSTVRAMGANVVIAVDLNTEPVASRPVSGQSKIMKWLTKKTYPTSIDIIDATVAIMQRKITDENLKTDPADVVINSKLGHIKLFDFHLAEHMIELGYKAAKKVIPKIKRSQ
jgi:NTE family protein